MDKIKLILGTMTFGPQVLLEDSQEMIQNFVCAGFDELDTAYVYNEGETERMLGQLIPQFKSSKLKIATKANPRITGRLDRKAVKSQLEESLQRMQRDSVDIFYLHFPDPRTPVEEALEACSELHCQGKFTELGLSNFPAWLVVHAWHVCKERGWPTPTVYQGLYNGLSRNAEKELFPALKQLGMRYYAYNPLAGGLLSGKHSAFEEQPSHGRFTLRPNYQNRYWKKSLFEAVNTIKETCTEHGITLIQAAFRWLAFHSHLNATRGDGILLGASKVNQVVQNIEAMNQGELPDSITDAFNNAWDIAKAESPDYFKYYKG